MTEDDTSILTASQRQWLRDETDVSHERQMRKRIYGRIRAAVLTDGKLLARAFEDGDLNTEAIGRDLDFAELGDGVSSLVAALYRLCDASGLDAERTIQKGIREGKKGRIGRLEDKLESEGAKELKLGELRDLQDARPELHERLERAFQQDMSDLETNFGMYSVDTDE